MIPKKGIKFVDKLFKTYVIIDEYEELVKEEYIKYFGKDEGLIEFNKNYICLKILDSYEGMNFPEPIKIPNFYAETLRMVD